MNSKNILLTGGTGFLGSALVDLWLQQGHKLTVLTRNPAKVALKSADQLVLIDNLSVAENSRFDAIVNLAGAPIFASRWTAKRKQIIRDSRIKLTQQLVNLIAVLPEKPSVFISGSAIGIYGNQADLILTENSPSIPDFSQQLCADWEAAASFVEALGIRLCIIRTGLVLARHAGILHNMLPAFQLGLGGKLGNGQQWMSWIHLQDWLLMVDSLLHNPDCHGVYNLTAPQAVTNQQFSQLLAVQLHRPQLMPLPAWFLKLMLGEMSALLLGSQRVSPDRFLTDGYQFQFPELQLAFQQIFTRQK